MTRLTITLDLNDEQFDALSAYTAEWNGPNGTSTNAERLCDDAVMPFVDQKVEMAYQNAVRNLGTAARSLTYEQRKAIIAQVTQQVTQP